MALGQIHRWLAFAGTLAGLSSVIPSFILPLSCVPWLHGHYPLLRYYGRSDSRWAALRASGAMNTVAPQRVSLITVTGASSHSVSNHQRDDRGPPGCPAFRLAAYRPLYRLRPSLAGSPVLADRIEFTADCPTAALCYGLVVLVPLLSTSPLGDAVTVRYLTTLRRKETDSHRSIPVPSQAHERGHSCPPFARKRVPADRNVALLPGTSSRTQIEERADDLPRGC